jgi:hypothetical protein
LKLGPPSLEEKLKLAQSTYAVPDGPELMNVSGGQSEGPPRQIPGSGGRTNPASAGSWIISVVKRAVAISAIKIIDALK